LGKNLSFKVICDVCTTKKEEKKKGWFDPIIAWLWAASVGMFSLLPEQNGLLEARRQNTITPLPSKVEASN
jgi:hypothetical protein